MASTGSLTRRTPPWVEGQFASVYDDFIVPSGSGWNVTAVFSDNLPNTRVTGANWEIRQGVSEGNGGTLIASGTTITPVVTDTGRSGFRIYRIHGRGYRTERSFGARHLLAQCDGRLATARAVRLTRTTNGATAWARHVATTKTRSSIATSLARTLRRPPMRASPSTTPWA